MKYKESQQTLVNKNLLERSKQFWCSATTMSVKGGSGLICQGCVCVCRFSKGGALLEGSCEPLADLSLLLTDNKV